jgi:hypothetical protein
MSKNRKQRKAMARSRRKAARHASDIEQVAVIFGSFIRESGCFDREAGWRALCKELPPPQLEEMKELVQ